MTRAIQGGGDKDNVASQIVPFSKIDPIDLDSLSSRLRLMPFAHLDLGSLWGN